MECLDIDVTGDMCEGFNISTNAKNVSVDR